MLLDRLDLLLVLSFAFERRRRFEQGVERVLNRRLRLAYGRLEVLRGPVEPETHLRDELLRIGQVVDPRHARVVPNPVFDRSGDETLRDRPRGVLAEVLSEDVGSLRKPDSPHRHAHPVPDVRRGHVLLLVSGALLRIQREDGTVLRDLLAFGDAVCDVGLQILARFGRQEREERLSVLAQFRADLDDRGVLIEDELALLVEAGFRQVAELQPVVALQVPDDLDTLAGERHEAEGHAGLGIADVEYAPQVVLRRQALMTPGTVGALDRDVSDRRRQLPHMLEPTDDRLLDDGASGSRAQVVSASQNVVLKNLGLSPSGELQEALGGKLRLFEEQP